MSEDTQTITIYHGEAAYEFDPALFTAEKKQAFDHLTNETNAKAEFKDVVESLSTTTGMPKPLISKYLKARFKAETQKAKELGNLFEALDDAGV